MKIIYTILFCILFYFQSSSQSIQNTKWQTYNPTLVDTITVEIKTDTIHQYIDSDSILVSSIFTEMTDTVTLIDVAGPLACIMTDTGIYSFSINNDTLTVSLLTDPCLQRSLVFDGVVLWRIDKPVGLAQTTIDKKSINIYPNPSNGLVNIQIQDESWISIYHSTGQLILENKNQQANSTLQVNLDPGTFFVVYRTESEAFSKKLIVH